MAIFPAIARVSLGSPVTIFLYHYYLPSLTLSSACPLPLHKSMFSLAFHVVCASIYVGVHHSSHQVVSIFSHNVHLN